MGEQAPCLPGAAPPLLPHTPMPALPALHPEAVHFQENSQSDKIAEERRKVNKVLDSE